MIRTRIAVVLGALTLGGVALVPAAGASAATLELRNTARFGQILTNSAGFTIYAFESDSKNFDLCQSISGCTHVWPPLLAVEGEPITVGPRLRGNKVGTITLASGAKQITYNHHPLYGYIGDTLPEQTSYVGAVAFGGYWWALNRNGNTR
jgi:predicted lipoprotein with Yx(FWY)xxD motif